MRRYRNDDDEVRETPGTVVAAAAAATVPLPFLGVYAVMFIVHGGIHPVAPPDITDTLQGELWAGIIALVFFVVSATALIWMLNGRRRWPFAVMQVLTLGIAIDFVIDVTKGGRSLSAIIAVAAAIALVCAFLPPSDQYLGHTRRRRRARAAMAAAGVQGPSTSSTPAGMPAGSAPVSDTTPTTAGKVGQVGRPSPRKRTESV